MVLEAKPEAGIVVEAMAVQLMMICSMVELHHDDHILCVVLHVVNLHLLPMRQLILAR